MALSREGIVNVALAGIGSATKVVLDLGATAVGAGPLVSIVKAGAEALAGYQVNRLASRADRADARRSALGARRPSSFWRTSTSPGPSPARSSCRSLPLRAGAWTRWPSCALPIAPRNGGRRS
jgi:hypothetical protein